MSFKEIGAPRLLALADILDAADAAHVAKGEPVYRQTAFAHDCGTPACALGHWAHHNQDRWTYDGRPCVGAAPRLRRGSRNTYKDAAKEFHISHNENMEDEADELFGGCGCGEAETGKEAAAYIRDFVFRKLKCED